jgi:F420-0:gamma-glutamyl ligase-like protein
MVISPREIDQRRSAATNRRRNPMEREATLAQAIPPAANTGRDLWQTVSKYASRIPTAPTGRGRALYPDQRRNGADG